MSLQKQLVHLNMSGGLQKKEDPLIAIPSKLAAADNLEFDDLSTVIMRGGQVKQTLPAGYTTAIRSFVRQGTAQLEFENGATIRANGSTIASDYGAWRGVQYSYEPAHFMRVGVSTRRVLGNRKPTSVLVFDAAYGVTNYCIAWGEIDDVTGASYVAASIRSISTDVELQRVIIAGGASSETVSNPRVIYDATNQRFAIFTYFEDTAFVTASMRGSYVAEAGGSVTGPTSLISMTYAAGPVPIIDAALYAGQGYALAAVDCATNVKLRIVDLGLTPTIATVTGAPATTPTSLVAHATYSAGVLTAHAFYGAGANLRGRRVPSNTGVIAAESTVTTLTGSIGRIATVDSGSDIYLVLDQTSSTSNTYATTYLVSATTAHAFNSKTAINTNCFIAGRIFTMRSRNCIPLVFTSNSNQSTHFVLDVSEAAGNLGNTTAAEPLFVSRLDYGEVAWSSLASTSGYTQLRVPGTNSAFVPYLKFETDLRMAGTVNATLTCVSAAKFAPTEQLGEAEVNGLAVLAGALPLVCDGAQMVEEGFHWGPEVQGAALTPVATGTGVYTFPSVGSFQVAFTEGWEDAQGNWHESALGSVLSLTTTVGNLDINPTFIRPPSLKNSRQLILYRTKALGTDTSLYLGHAGDLVGSTEVNDTDLARGEQLYTAGGVLPNTPAPACRHISVFQKRLVLAGCGDGSRVYWSKQTTPGYGVEFSSDDPTHQTQVPSDKGRVVGTKELDGRLVILCENGVGVIGGQGPAPTGTSGQYSDFESVITETGCSWDSPKSIVRAPEGVWFRSPFGLRLVSRALSLARGQDGKQAGAEVDSLVSGTVVAVAGDTKQQIRFYQSSGTVLVWDYQWGQWSRFTGFANVDACYADDRFYHLSNYSTTSPLLRYTSNTTYVDVDDANTSNSLFQMTIETPWLSFAGIQGFQRVYRLLVLGASTGTQTFGMTFVSYLNFGTNFADLVSTTITPAAGANHEFQLQHHFTQQKCETMKFALIISPTNSSADGRLRLTDLTLQVGVKGGYFKMPSTARF